MATKEQDLVKLKNLKAGESCTINWYEEGGGVVYRLPNLTYILFSVPQFGGDESFEGFYGGRSKIPEILEKAYSWC